MNVAMTFPVKLKDPSLLTGRAYIGGRWRDGDGGATFPVVNPSTLKPIQELADCSVAMTTEAIDAAFLWFYGAEIRGVEGRVGVLPDAFRVGAVDLDEDGAEEAVIQGLSPDFCGPEGCQHWVLEGLGRQDPPRISGRLLGFDLQAAATGGRGGRDLIASSSMGLLVYRNDGDGWALPAGDGN